MMPYFSVEQVLNCEVRVWYRVEAPTHEQALRDIASVDCPTCVDGRDYEIITDGSVVSTIVKEQKEWGQ